MKLPRSSGILLHPTSLPGPFGIGDLGPQAFRFVELLASCRQRVWEVLPLGPAGKGNSPYQCVSAFAGNPMLISPERLLERGYLLDSELRETPSFPDSRVDFDRVIPYKFGLYRLAFSRFEETDAFREFERNNHSWLDPFARFMVLQEAAAFAGSNNTASVDPIEIRFQKFLQFEFFRQWAELRDFSRSRGVAVMGDIPFYVDADSVDVWANPEIFDLDEERRPRHIGGVPPDYFSADGQLWGNPVYHWDRIKHNGYRWWIDRLRRTFELVDFARLDHFRGFEAFWEVRAGETTARHGRWVPGPGADFFEVATRELGPLPLVAENLGEITPAVEQLREQFGFPGMGVLQFAFGEDSLHRPHRYTRDFVAFTSTHDNNTALGWWREMARHHANRLDRHHVDDFTRASLYLGANDHDVHWAMIRAVMTSVADLAIVPLQDLLGLDESARMNVPGEPKGNWEWRCLSSHLHPEPFERLRALTVLTDR